MRSTTLLLAGSLVACAVPECGPTTRNCDQDGDGFEVSTHPIDLFEGCFGNDCDDSNPAVHPSAADQAGDRIDENCDGADGLDDDGDGFASLASGGDDCDDGDWSISPEETERLGDGIDQDCDGFDTPDDDGDEHAPLAFGGDDCDDEDASTHPGAPEVFGDGIDQDCDGVDTPDADGDGHAPGDFGGDDCNDASAAIFPGAEGDWVRRAVAGADDGTSPAIAIDASGALHLAFTDGDWRVAYASDASGAWEITSIETDGRDAEIGLGPAGEVHVTYFLDLDPGAEDRYAVNDGSGWIRESLGAHAGSRPALAIDTSGNPHVLLDTALLDVLHGVRVGGAWSYETVAEGIGDGVGGSDLYLSLALDASGVVHATYENRGLEYARGDSGMWSEHRIDGSFQHASLALDPDGAVHVAYQIDSRDLRHADNSTGVWQHMDLEPNAGADASIVAGADGSLHVAHHGDGAVRYSSRTSGAWYSETVDRAESNEGSSMVLDPDGLPVIAYGNAGLWIARRGPADDVDDDCDGVPW